MAFSPDLAKAREAYLAYGAELFALCYLHAGGPKGANARIGTLLCDMNTSPGRWRLASSGKTGLFRCAHQVCMDQYYTRPKRQTKRKKDEPRPPLPALPFVMTDALRALLSLHPKYKTPLYLRLALGWSTEDAAAVIGGPAARAKRLCARGLKKAKLTEERARQALSLIAPMPGGPEEQWDSFLIDREDKSFGGQQRLRRFKRWMDHAIPYIALGVVVFCVLCYQGVERGWFTGQAYVPAVPLASQPAEDYGVGTAAVFSPEGDGYIRYDVTDCPLDPETLLRQMVALGAAPEGTRVLSARREGGCLTLELSEEAAQAESREMMAAMSATFAAAYPELTELRLIAAGKELSLWEQFPREIEPERTVTTPYHQ